MDEGAAKGESLDFFTSWAALTLLVASAASFAWYVPRNRDVMLQIFADFHLALPRCTAIACAAPTFVIVGLSAVAILGAIVVQFRSSSLRSAALFHLLLVLTFGALFLFYREAMGNAFITLVEGMSAGPVGR